MKWGNKYTARHVNILSSMLARHLHMDYELVCITDDPEGVGCRTIPIWDDDSEGCFRRLEIFHPRMREILGGRFVSIDLDCVILGDVTPLLSRKEDFVIWQHPVKPGMYCGSMFMMTTGVRSEVASAPRVRNRWRGTDQAVIRVTLGPDEAVWTRDDGVYMKQPVIPENARVVFYPGPRDPSRDKWAIEHWR